MKRIITLLLIALITVALVACGSNNTSQNDATQAPNSGHAEPSGTGELHKVAFICKGYTDTMCLQVMNLFDEYCKENYADLFAVDYFDGELDPDKINQLIETCTAAKYDVIVMQQQDSDAPVASVKAAVEAGTQVIVTVGSINDDGESYYIDSDPYEQGKIAAEYLVEKGKLGKGTKVAILQGPAGQFHSNGRTDAFLDVIEECGAELVAQEICEWQKSLAQTCMENWLVAYPDLEVILSCCDDMSNGAIEAMKLAGREMGSITISSIDANIEGCLSIKEGTLFSTVSQDILGYAYEAADYAAKLIKNEPVQSKMLESVLVADAAEADRILKEIHGLTQEEIDKLSTN
jgi:inositol transport system substrate-binding protein